MRAEIMPLWGELQLKAQDSASGARLIAAVAANPTGVDMSRVASTMRTIGDLAAGRLAPAAAKTRVVTSQLSSLSD